MPFLYSNPYIILYVSHSGWWSSLTWRHFCWRKVVSTVKIFHCGHEFPAYTTFFHVGVSNYPIDHNDEKKTQTLHIPALLQSEPRTGLLVFFSNFYYAASTFIKYFTNDVDFHIKSPITFCLIRYNITIYFLSMSDADRYLVQYSFIDSWSRRLLLDTRYNCVSCVYSLFWKRYLPIPGII